MVKFKMVPVLEVFTILDVSYEGKCLIKSLFRKVESLILLGLLMIAIASAFSFLPHAKAETSIISMTPASGSVGSLVLLTANITSVNGSYSLFFDDSSLLSGNAVGNLVNVSFPIRDAVMGNHTIRVLDVVTGENVTRSFEVLTSYLLNVSVPKTPQQFQEGDSVPINVTITGADPTVTYIANVTVRTPNNASFTNLVSITASSFGNASVIINYDRDFSNGANTNLTGKYDMLLNTTLATGTFTVGLTNSTEYHRNDILDVKAMGYAPDENVNLSITGTDFSHSVNLTAGLNGMVHYVNQTALSNASIGTYALNILSITNTTRKDPADAQIFRVPGFSVNVTTRNLAGEPVSSVLVRAFYGDKSIASITSDSNGTIHLSLEVGSYLCNASLSRAPDQKIGEEWLSINDSASFDLICNLTNLRVVTLALQGGTGVRIPAVNVQVVSQQQNQSLINTTDIDGTTVMHSLPPNFTYVVNASRYETLFNVTTLPDLFENGSTKGWKDIVIVCPIFTVQVNVTNPNASHQPINDAVVKVQELMGGLYYENTTINGLATFNCVLGKYSVRVYDVSGSKLNETIVLLNGTIVNVPFSCKLYGLSISIRVADYLDQSIPNVNVTLERSDSKTSAMTGADGQAPFGNTIGGNLRVTAYLPGQTEPCIVVTSYVDNSTTLTIRVEKYVLLAGMLVETNQLLAVLIILVPVIVILSIEIYRRRQSKPQESES